MSRIVLTCFPLVVIGVFLFGCSERSPGTSNPPWVNDTGSEAATARPDTTVAEEDTVFLFREDTPKQDHAIYIEKDRNSSHYRWMTDFTWDGNSETAYREGLQYFLARSNSKYRPEPTGLPRNWLPLFQHEGRFVLYAPSDHGNARKRIINDTAFVFWYMDGPTPIPIQGIHHTNPKTTELDLLPLNDQWPKSEKLIVHLLDTVPMMAVFEFTNEPTEHRYSLYTPVESAIEFDMVVNYSNNKRLEFEFERIDYTMLLKGH